MAVWGGCLRLLSGFVLEIVNSIGQSNLHLSGKVREFKKLRTVATIMVGGTFLSTCILCHLVAFRVSPLTCEEAQCKLSIKHEIYKSPQDCLTVPH